MEKSMRELYAGYLRAVEFFNAQVHQKYVSEAVRAAFYIHALSEEEFPGWWNLICDDEGTKSRWLERFEDPAGYFQRTCERITKELGQIPIQNAAA